MLERILDYERAAFFLLNGSDSPFWDRFMWLYSGKSVWLPLAFLIGIILVYKKNWHEVFLILLAIVLVITLCDQFASHFCKPFFSRFRPTHHPAFMNQVKIVFDYRGGDYGFISSHAANAFGFATFMSLLFRYRVFTGGIFLWAVCSAYSRIYLGVHFISDVICGAFIGLLFGYGIYVFYVWIRKQLLGTTLPPPSSLYSLRQKQIITLGIFVTILIVLIFNYPLIAILH
ncbi:MAG: phosphatase PAP2 family protein [Tannerellaceae bacterium]|jgi:undecaprenyl-diphosphatase|nr:phosphatase PAP2 family protein [Tannerellaceae bacterium]